MSRRIGAIVSGTCMAVLTLGAVPAMAQVAQQPVAGEFRAGGYPETFGGVFYPAAELRALPAARAQAVVTDAQYRRAQTGLGNAVADVRRSFLRSPELTAALAEEKAAFEELAAARERAIADLKQDSTYQAAVELRSRLAEQIEEAKYQADQTPQERMAMASLKMSYATTISTMESAAIAGDPRVRAARQRLVAAGKQIAILYQAFDENVRNSPDVLAARKAVDDTRVASLGADALWVEARGVARVAMNYAHFLYDVPAYPPVVASPIYGGYGYPIQSGFQVGYPVTYPNAWWSQPGPR